jgi:hypothetical protein
LGGIGEADGAEVDAAMDLSLVRLESHRKGLDVKIQSDLHDVEGVSWYMSFDLHKSSPPLHLQEPSSADAIFIRVSLFLATYVLVIQS